jgi:hypothetical protein
MRRSMIAGLLLVNFPRREAQSPGAAG